MPHRHDDRFGTRTNPELLVDVVSAFVLPSATHARTSSSRRVNPGVGLQWAIRAR
jgi:hypothetical protein